MRLPTELPSSCSFHNLQFPLGGMVDLAVGSFKRMASTSTTPIPQLGFRAVQILKSSVTVISVLHYGFLPISLTLLRAVRNHDITYLSLYLTVEQVLLFSLLGVNRTRILLLALFASPSYLYLTIYKPHLLISPTEEPHLLSLILETFTNVSIILLASHVSRSNNISPPTAAWLSVVVLQSLILWNSRSWTWIPLLEPLNPWSDISFLKFYSYNLVLFARLLLNTLIVPIFVNITSHGEMKMKLRPGPLLALRLARRFFYLQEEINWVLELKTSRAFGNGTWEMTRMCYWVMVKAPVVYIAWVLLKVFVGMTVDLLREIIRIVFWLPMKIYGMIGEVRQVAWDEGIKKREVNSGGTVLY
ncbi:hypothetical protein DL95DRAFT_409076 [Leptodontidium sp. 2 PMI_412]|nr:hypothetical protein BKA61DRAFT_684179 [Leptodontidium sp. MPI-SDFR-AT-0119]KAH9214697.1 hypothetical protein DL95DRAFT_409076 [Leptodontidium sp. 2 PMI_412]